MISLLEVLIIYSIASYRLSSVAETVSVAASGDFGWQALNKKMNRTVVTVRILFIVVSSIS